MITKQQLDNWESEVATLRQRIGALTAELEYNEEGYKKTRKQNKELIEDGARMVNLLNNVQESFVGGDGVVYYRYELMANETQTILNQHNALIEQLEKGI